MTDLEIFKMTISFIRPPRVLYHFDCVEDLHKRMVQKFGEDYKEKFGCMRRKYLNYMWKGEKPSVERFLKYYDETLPEKAVIDERGVAKIQGSFYHFSYIISLLKNAKSLADIENYPWPVTNGWDFSHYPATVAEAHREGKIVVASIGHIYENAWQIRGYEEFLIDLVERPSWAECLLDKITEANLIKAVEAAKAGADILMCGDDIANQRNLMFNPEIWRRFIKSKWYRIWSNVREYNREISIWYHSDGNISEIIGELIDAGVTILNPLQPECMDLDEIYLRYKGKIVFDGCIGTQTTMPFGTPYDVKERIKYVIEHYGQEGGLIISPTHILEPDVPLENIEAFVDACRTYGSYS